MIRNSDLLVISAKIRRLLDPQKSLFGDVHSKIHRNLHIVVKKVLYFKIGNHTTYSRNNKGKKCEGNGCLWFLNKIIKRMSPESLKKIVGAI